MSVLNPSAREITAKIVYYGPGLSGKTTSLKRVYESIKPSHRGEMITLPTENDRTLFFDFLPVRVERVGEATIRLALYTVPGQVFYNATRKLVLQGADGVVFVADSRRDALDVNLESMDNLGANLKEMGYAPESFPLVIQYNKRDLAGALPVADLRRTLNPRGVPDFETVAQRGTGVLDALRAITRAVIRSLKDKGVMLSRPRNTTAVPAIRKGDETSIANQVSQFGDSAAATACRPHAEAGLVAALVPETFAPEATLAEADFRAGLNRQSVVRSVRTLRALAARQGEPAMSEVERTLLLGLAGPDYARLLRIHAAAEPSRDEAAFALLMLAMAGVRQRA